MIRSQIAQRALGALMLSVSLAVLFYTWLYAQEHDRIFRLWVLAPPALAVFSLGMLLFPIDVEKLQREHGVERVQSWAHLPPVWRGLLVLAGLSALTNHYLLTGRLI